MQRTVVANSQTPRVLDLKAQQDSQKAITKLSKMQLQELITERQKLLDQLNKLQLELKFNDDMTILVESFIGNK